jgi:1,4-dihydroxy-6-naphthoate synthase
MMTSDRELTIAYTPDSDDAFYYFALETGRVRLPDGRPAFRRAPMAELNRAASRGASDVTAISSAHYPRVADRYAVLSVGTSVGRGYGPVLVGRRPTRPEELRGERVGVGGVTTTGAFLLRRLVPEAVEVEMAFDRIADAVAAGELAAGVMIHEELLYYPRWGGVCVADLGALWCAETRLPLPVGLNVVRRDLGPERMQAVCAAVRQSLRYGLEHREEALDWVKAFGRGEEGRVQRRFVEMFANDDSLRMPADVREGLDVLLRQVVEADGSSWVPRVDIVEGTRGRVGYARRRF